MYVDGVPAILPSKRQAKPYVVVASVFYCVAHLGQDDEQYTPSLCASSTTAAACHDRRRPLRQHNHVHAPG